jgi:hypothetical protein
LIWLDKDSPCALSLPFGQLRTIGLQGYDTLSPNGTKDPTRLDQQGHNRREGP